MEIRTIKHEIPPKNKAVFLYTFLFEKYRNMCYNIIKIKQGKSLSAYILDIIDQGGVNK